MADELEQAVIAANRDPQVRVIVLRGAGRAFCAGFDFSEDFGHFKDELTTQGALGPREGPHLHDQPFRGARPQVHEPLAQPSR